MLYFTEYDIGEHCFCRETALTEVMDCDACDVCLTGENRKEIQV